MKKEEVNKIVQESMEKFFESKMIKKSKRDYKQEIIDFLKENPTDSLELKFQMKCSETLFYFHMNQLIEDEIVFRKINGKKRIYSLNENKQKEIL